MVAMDLWDDQAWFELATGQVRLARANGTLSWLPFALDYLPRSRFRPASCRGDGPAGGGRAHRPGEQGGHPPYVSLLLAAWRGDAPAAAELAEEMIRAPATGARARR